MSGFVLLLPYIEMRQLFDRVVSTTPSFDGTVTYPPYGPVPWTPQYPPWCTNIPRAGLSFGNRPDGSEPAVSTRSRRSDGHVWSNELRFLYRRQH